MKVGPIPVTKSVRPDRWRGLTSTDPGVLCPVAFFPLLREDAISGQIMLQVKSEETVKVVLNPVRVRAEAWLVPYAALPRFWGSMDFYNRSYTGTTTPGAGTTPVWSQALGGATDTDPDDKGVEFFDALGIHYGAGAPPVSRELLEAYNVIVNYQRESVLSTLPTRTMVTTTLAEAFWDNQRFKFMQPSFDAASMEGVVPVGIDGMLPLPITRGSTVTASAAAATLASATNNVNISSSAGSVQLFLPPSGTMAAYLGDADGATISLANIETAKQTRAFAALKDRYKNVSDDYLVDLLMSGIRIPDEAYKAPLLLGETEAVLGQAQRFATDGASLSESVSNMSASLMLRVSTPPVNPGGWVMVLLSVVPEQLYERVYDPAVYFNGATPQEASYPDYMSDFLDPQKVDVVLNKDIDVFHATPDGVFGYAPLNWKWWRNFSRVGGRFKRPKPDAFVEERQRIWAAEQVNPTLGDSFYLCPKPFPKSVFAVTTAHPYEVFTVADMTIRGNTVFGPAFGENQDSYAEVILDVDTSRINQTSEAAVDGETAEGEE